MTDDSLATEHLFSYGTLQLEAVQLATFGRHLAGRADRLPGFDVTLLEITDAAVLATSGLTHHPILLATGRPEHGVAGSVFALTPAELARADAYEVADYRRERVRLESGLEAWVYLDARAAATPASQS